YLGTCAVRGPCSQSRPAALLAPAQSLALLGSEDSPPGPAAQPEGRSRCHELVGRNALPVSGRGGVFVPGQDSPAMEAPRPQGQVHGAPAWRTLATTGDRLAAQGHVPCPVR